MERVPDWMRSVKVDFVCNNCPKHNTKNIVFAKIEQIFAPAVPKASEEAIAVPIPDDEE